MPTYTVIRPSWFSSMQQLREGGRVIGELTMLKKWSYALAEARMPKQAVRFGYDGWFKRSLFIRDVAGNTIAVARSLSWWKYDTSVMIDGKEYVWKQKDWWGIRFGWFTADGKEIIDCRVRWWRTADITSHVSMGDTEMVLLFFGMYLMKLQEMDAAASGA